MWECPTQLIGMRSDAYVKCLLSFCACLLLVLLLPGITIAEDDECDFQQFATPEGLYYNSEVECERRRDGKDPYDPPLCESEVEGACICSTTRPLGLRQERCVEPTSYSSYNNPTVRFSNYLSGLKVNERELGIGDCTGGGDLRFCARLAPHIGTARYASTEEERDELEEIYQTYGNTITPEKLRLCVYWDDWDVADTKYGYSPFHHNTSVEDAGRVMAMINRMHAGVGSAAANGPGTVATIVANLALKRYNHQVWGVVGCAPVPLAPFPPEFCDTCDVTPPTPDPTFEFAADATFAEPTIIVAPLERIPNLGGGIGSMVTSIIIASTPITVEVDSCDETGTYCSILRSNGRRVCLEMNTAAHQNRIVGCRQRPDYMPLPVVFRDLDSADPLAMKVSLSSGGRTEQKTLYAADANAKCSDFMGVELCSDRPCVEFNHETEECTLYGTDVCLQGYQPERFDVEGYHPSKGVVADTVNSNIVQGEPNSFDDGKYYFEYPDPEMLDENDELYASNQTLRPFTQQELDLCISSPSVFTTPGQSEYIVPDRCTMIEVQVWGAGGAGHHDTAGTHHGGGGGGYTKVRIPVTPGDRFYTQTGRGGKAMGEEGGRSYFSRNRTTHDIRANGGGNNVEGPGAPWDRSEYITDSYLGGSVVAGGIPGMTVIETQEGDPSHRWIAVNGVGANASNLCLAGGGGSGGNAGMSVGSCRSTPGGMIAANASTYGAGGCACAVWFGTWGQGTDGAVAVDCVAYENEDAVGAESEENACGGDMSPLEAALCEGSNRF